MSVKIHIKEMSEEEYQTQLKVVNKLRTLKADLNDLAVVKVKQR